MCAIFGIAFLDNHKFRNNNALSQLINNLMTECQDRGRDATGLAFVHKQRIAVIKHNVKADRFSRLKAVKNAVKIYADLKKVDGPEKLKMILGHCRQETKGTHKIKHNNHPIITDKVVGVHNGIIRNDDALFANYATVPEIIRKGSVDSEVIFRLIDYYSNQKGIGTKYGIIDTCNKLEGTFACAMVNKRDNDVLWLFKARNPTDVLYYPKAGVVIFASANWYIKRAIHLLGVHLSTDFGACKEIEYPPESALSINVLTRKAHRFNIYKTNERRPATTEAGVFGINYG